MQAALIALAAVIAYAGSLRAPLVFDDLPSIADNASIRHLWPPTGVLRGPEQAAATPAGRPVLNLSLALNYAVGGTRVWGYHALNLIVHVLAGWTLLGIVRRTAVRCPRMAAQAAGVGFAVALLWTVHPLQTESVTYIVQRAESLAGLFYLLTVYCFVRAAEGDGVQPAEPGAPPQLGGAIAKLSLPWGLLSFLACLLGMATKEVVATAPFIVLLYDRTFLAGSLGEALRRRWRMHLALFSSLALLAWLVASTGWNRGGSIGFGLRLDWARYELTQLRAIARYVRLSLWPRPLVFDYEPFEIRGLADVLPSAALVFSLLGASAWALAFRPVWGFLGAWFFAILAPTSLVPGANQMIAEHRMYLPLAAIIAAVACAAVAAAPRLRTGVFRRNGFMEAILALLALALVAATIRRNAVYASDLSLWADTLAKRPANAAAAVALANALVRDGRPDEAIAPYEQALRARPDYADAHYDFGLTLKKLGRRQEAGRQLSEAVRLEPGFAPAHFSLANVLDDIGREPEAVSEYREALRLQPDYADAHYNLGLALAKSGRAAGAIEEFEAAVRLEPGNALARTNLGIALAQAGRMDDAIRQFEEAVKADPRSAASHGNLALALRAAGRDAEAAVEAAEAARLRGRGN